MVIRSETAPKSGATTGSEALTLSRDRQIETTELQTQPSTKVIEEDVHPMVKAGASWQRTLNMHDRIVLIAQTGSGKSSDAPMLAYESLIKDDPNAQIIVAQPTRLAARELAKYVGSKVGRNNVGYRYKGENTTTDDTRITYTVDASLLNEISSDPLLRKYRVVVLDERHMRTAVQDVLLADLKKAQDQRRKAGLMPLKVIVASGTLDKQAHLDYLPGSVAFEVPGRLFPVVPHYSDHEIDEEDLPAEAAKKAAEIIEERRKKGVKIGKILIFMKGKRPIDDTIRELRQNEVTRRIRHISLMGGEQKSADQDRIYDDEEQIIVSTNVAEQSLTVPGVTVVIDSGLMNVMMRDPQTGLMSLQTIFHTKSNMTQRAGRAGRLEHGEVYYLFTKGQADARPEFLQPEILRTDLTEIVLKLKRRGLTDISTFDFMDKPTKESIDSAIDTLKKLGALDSSGNITRGERAEELGIGEEMEEMPMDPHFARMLIEAKKHGCVEAVSILIGFMSNKRRVFAFNPNREDFEKKYDRFIDKDSDFITLLRIWNDYVENVIDKKVNRRTWALSNGFSNVMYDVETAKDDLLEEDFFKGLKINKSNHKIDLEAQAEAIKKCISVGFMDRILESSRNGTYELADGRKKGIVIDAASAIRQHPAKSIISAGIDVDRSGETYARLNQRISNEVAWEISHQTEHIKKAQEEEEHAAVAAADIMQEARGNEPTSAALNIPSELVSQRELSLGQRIKQTIASVVNRIKKFFGR